MKPKSSLRHFLALAGSSLIAVSSAHAVDGTWSTINSGTWSTPGNWLGSPDPVPGGVGSIISIESNITGARTVTIDTTSRTVGHLTMGDSTHGFTIAASGGASLIFDNGLSDATLTENFTTGLADFITAPITLNSNLAITTNGSLTVSGEISGLSKGITKSGAGTLIMTGTNSYTGTTTINAGILNLGNSTADGSLASTGLALGGGTLSYTRTGSTTQTFSTTAINAGGSSVSTVAGNTLALGTITRSIGGTLNVGADGTTTTSNSNVNGILGPWASFNTGASTTYATVSGANIVGLGYTGGADGVAPGAASIVTDTTGLLNYSVNTGTGTFGTDASINTLRYTAGASTLTTATSFTTNGIMNSGSGVLTISGNITIGATNELVLNAANSGITISNAIGNNGSTASSVTKTGSGTAILNGVNTYTSNTFVNQGTLQIGNNNGALLGSSGTYAGNISISAGATLSIGSNVSQTLSGIISGNGNLTKANSGTLFLGNNNTYTGQTTISPTTSTDATISITSFNSVVGGTASSSLGAPTTVANGTIVLGSTAAGRRAAIIYTGAGETTDRVIDFRFNNVGSQHTISNTGEGLLKFTSAATKSTGASTNGGVILDGDGNGEFTQGLNFAFGNLIKNGNGTWTIGGPVGSGNGTNVLTVNAGTLALQKKSSLHNGLDTNWTAAKINVKSGATLALNVDSGDVDGLSATSLDTLLTNIYGGTSTSQGLQAGAILGLDTSTATGGSFTQGNAITNSTGTGGGSLGLTKLGTGTLVLDKTNTYTGATNVNGGSLIINGATSSTSAVSVGASGTLGGGGTIGGALAVTGVLSPGDSITPADTLTLGSTLTLNANATLALGLGTTSDLISFSSLADNLTGSGNATLQLSLLSGFSYANTYTIFQNTSTSGFTLSDITGYDDVNYTANFFDGGDSYLLNFTAIPEPGAALLGSIGLIALLRRRR